MLVCFLAWKAPLPGALQLMRTESTSCRYPHRAICLSSCARSLSYSGSGLGLRSCR